MFAKKKEKKKCSPPLHHISLRKLRGAMPPKNKKGSELGRAIIRRQAADSRQKRSAGLGFAAADVLADAGAPLQSVTDLTSLEEFLSHAAMAEQTFTAERGQSTFAGGGPGGQAGDGRAAAAAAARASASPAALPAGASAAGGTVLRWLRIPRRPRWEETSTAAELQGAETAAFLSWRREVARLEAEVQAPVSSTAPAFGGIGIGSGGEAAVTPFEKNLAIWQQLWRVVEKADVLVQIVDARDPAFYFCPDVDAYVAEVSPAKRTLVLVNKADYLTPAQREAWAAYFDSAGRDYAFFSARDELQKMEAEDTAQRGASSTLLGRADEPQRIPAAITGATLATAVVGPRALKPSVFGVLAGVDNGDELMAVEDASAELTVAAVAQAEAGDEDEAEPEQEQASASSAERSKDPAPLSKISSDASGAAAASTAALSARSRILTRDELVDFFTARYGALPLQRQAGATPASLARYAALQAAQRAASRKLRAEELARRAEMREKMILAGLGAAVRFGDARDLAALDEGGDEADAEADAAAAAGGDDALPPPLLVGMVGYPNVGKSSTINALLGATAAKHSVYRVAVAATPGKTKHYQTLPLSDAITLIDCPGLVFPSFVSTREEMVVNGVLPIDQLRDFLAPVRLLCARIPRATLESTYGIKLPAPEPADPLMLAPAATATTLRQPTPGELLDTYCNARGFMGASHSGPDHARAARVLLKDYTEGKLLYAHAPAGGWARWCAAAAEAALTPAPAPALTAAPAAAPGRWDSVLAEGPNGGVPLGDLDAPLSRAHAGASVDAAAELFAARRVVRPDAAAVAGAGGDSDDDDDDDGQDEGGEDAVGAGGGVVAAAGAAGAQLWTRPILPPSKAKSEPVLGGGAHIRGGKPVPVIGPAVVAAAAAAGAGAPAIALRAMKKERRLRKGESRPMDPYGTGFAADAAIRAYSLDEQARVRALARIE